MIRLKIQDKLYKVIDYFSVKNSNNEVTFNDLKIDFSEGTKSDIPLKYQEIQLLKDDNVIFIGYVDNIKISKLSTDDPFKEMTLKVLSPLKLATKRTINLIGTYSLSNSILRVLQPLINDGYTIKEINVPEGQITVSFLIETVENAMNKIGFKRNIFWYINEKKEIFVNSIDSLFGKNIKKVITEDYEKGLLELQPTISNIDYANIINFKNVRLIYSSRLESSEYNIFGGPKTVKKGDMVKFNYPIILDENQLRARIEDLNGEEDFYVALDFSIGLENVKFGIDTTKNAGSNYNKYLNYSTVSVTLDTDAGEEGDIVLETDPFFTNVIVGFKSNIEGSMNITKIESDTALRYTTMKFLYSKEIDKLKGIISESGQIERTVNYEEKWISTQQLINYARSLMNENSNEINEVSIQYDINPNLNIGDIIEINRPRYFIDGKFAVKSIQYSYYNENKKIWKIIAKKSDFISSYIDLFRPVETQENANIVDTVILSEYIEESIAEKVVVGGDVDEN